MIDLGQYDAIKTEPCADIERTYTVYQMATKGYDHPDDTVVGTYDTRHEAVAVLCRDYHNRYLRHGTKT